METEELDQHVVHKFGTERIRGLKTFDIPPVMSLPFSSITSKPTTISGYGITDAARMFVVDTANNDTGDVAPDVQDKLDEATASGGGIVWLPSGKYRFATSGISIPSGVTLLGEGWSTNNGATDPSLPDKGTWIHVTGTGFNPIRFDGTHGAQLKNLGIYHDQPAPGPGWAPTIYPYAIDLRGVSLNANLIERVMLLNPSHGVGQNVPLGTQTSIGQLDIRGLYGQPFVIGMQLQYVLDFCRFTDFHFWNFWSDNANVTAYTLANTIGIQLEKVDNPKFVNITGFNQKYLFRLTTHDVVVPGNPSYGTVARLDGTNIDADGSNGVILMDGSEGTASAWSNVHVGGGPADLPAIHLTSAAAGHRIMVSNVYGQILPSELVKVDGTSQEVLLSNVRIYDWGNVDAAACVFENSSATNTVKIVNYHYEAGDDTKVFGGAAASSISRLNGNDTSYYPGDLTMGGKLALTASALPGAGAGNDGKFHSDGTNVYFGIAGAWVQLN